MVALGAVFPCIPWLPRKCVLVLPDRENRGHPSHQCEGKWADSRQGTVREQGPLEPSIIKLSTHFREGEVADNPRVISRGGFS